MVSQEEKLIKNEKHAHLCVEISMSLTLTLARVSGVIGGTARLHLSRIASCVEG